MSLQESFAKITTDLGKMIIKRTPEILAGTGIACSLAATVTGH